MTTELKNLKIELRLELQNILEYWMTHTIDSKNGGFIGQIDFENNRNDDADKGAVLNARILWAFSATYHLSKTKNIRILLEELLNTSKTTFLTQNMEEFFGV